MSTEELINYLEQRIRLLENEEKKMEDVRISYALDRVVKGLKELKELKIILDMKLTPK